MATKDDSDNKERDSAAREDSRPNVKKFGTMIGLGELDTASLQSLAEAQKQHASDPSELKGEGRASDPSSPSADESEPTAQLTGPAKDSGGSGSDPKKFKGTMMGLGDQRSSPSSKPPVAKAKEDSARVVEESAGGTDSTNAKSAQESTSGKDSASDKDSRSRKELELSKTVVGLGNETAPVPPEKAKSKESSKQAPGRKHSGKKADLGEGQKPSGSKEQSEKREPARPPESRSADRIRPSSSRSTPTEPASDTPSSSSGGALIWVALLAVIALGGLWFFNRSKTEPTMVAESEAPSTEPGAPVPAEPVAELEAAEPAPPAEPEVEAQPSEPAPPPQAELPPEPVPPAVVEPEPPPEPARNRADKAPAIVQGPSGSELAPKLSALVAIGKGSAPASRCRRKPDPPGTAQALVTFEPSGQVSNVRVLDQYAGTHTSKCLEAALKQITISSFSGESVTVSAPIQLY